MSGSAPGTAPLAVPPVNRVAAARKKLEEYKTKRKVNVKQDVADNTSESNKIVNHEAALNLVEKNDCLYDSNFESSDHTIHSKTNQYSFDLNNSTPINFFDELSNTVQYQQSEIKPESDNKYLLADVLFSNQNNNGNVSNDEIHHNVNSDNFHQESIFIENKSPESISKMFTENEKEPTGNNYESGNDNDGDSIDEAMSASAVIKLKQQLQFHMQTVEFLVSEKSALSSKVNKLENVVAEMKNQNNDISGRLSISRQRASCLEVEYSTMKEKYEDVTKTLNQAILENSKLKAAESSHVKISNDLKEELMETKSLVNIKLSENADLVKKVEELMFHINANEIRYQQLNQGYVQVPNNQSLIDENVELNQRIVNLNQELKQLDAEKNQSNAQYQLYVQQLNDQLELMSKKHESLVSVNEDLLNRESNLIQQMETLEKQLQSTIHISKNADVNVISKQEPTQSDEKTKVIEESNLDLQRELQKKETELQAALVEIAQNRIQIEELNSAMKLLQSEQPDVAKLNAANESDRIAAQKATAQNNKLKNEIENLQEAYNKMTENKLELVELLQAEKNLTKTLTLTLADNEEKLKKTQSNLVAKDEEMIRLQAESSVLEKEALKHAQIMDRLNHYEVQNQSSDILQKELELARTRLKSMAEENDRLKTILSDNNVLPNDDKSNEESLCINEETKILSEEIDPVGTEKLYNGEDASNKRILHSETCLHIPTNEAMKKLQERFTKLMDDVANLSDDKQRLEHLVLQLQGETETICEYIALYQKQRSILKQREYEKDIQLRLFTQERQKMKEQLVHLNELVQQLVIEYNNALKSKVPVLPHVVGEAQLEKADTADKIIKLLTDMTVNHLTETNVACDNLDNFHPCPWCSGKIIHI